MIKDAIFYNKDYKLDWHDPDEATDGYQLKFVGKDYARLQTGTKTETMIIPDVEHNEKEENKNSKNLFFTGDNLEVLKHLQNAYKNSIKMIYIDPPYNTGKEFVYSDNFEFSDEQLKAMLGLTDEEISRLHLINGRSSHSAWLTFMYPRLRIAQKLLTDDGVIFISIDDNEQANLKLLCDEIFGEQNFVACFIVIRSEGGGLAKQAVIGHDYVLVYSKNIDKFTPLGKPKDIRGKIVKINDEDFWIETDWLRKEFGKYGTCTYEEITSCLGESKKKEIDEGLKNNQYVLIKKGNEHVVGRYRKISEDTSKFYTILKHLNKNGNEDLENIEIKNCFDFPKPISLCKELILGSTILSKKNNEIILDFFAGSATTAHAVMQLNAEDGGNRRYIMVQLPELTKNDSEAQRQGFKTIDEISRKRIELAGEKIKQETNADIDYGFKHYYVKKVEDNTIARIEEFNPETAFIGYDNMIREFDNEKAKGEDVILTTWLVNDGYKFETAPETKDICGYKAYYIDNSTLYLISPNWQTEQTKKLLNLIGNNEFNLNTIIIYGYSFNFESMKELEINIKQNLSQNINIEKRY